MYSITNPPKTEGEWVQIAQSLDMINYRGFWFRWTYNAAGDRTEVVGFKSAETAVTRFGWSDQDVVSVAVKGSNADKIKKELDKAIDRFRERDHQLNHRLRWLLEGTA